MARQKRAEEKTARLAVVQIKRARAEARRAEYFEDLAETKRAAVAAERAAEVKPKAGKARVVSVLKKTQHVCSTVARLI